MSEGTGVVVVVHSNLISLTHLLTHVGGSFCIHYGGGCDGKS